MCLYLGIDTSNYKTSVCIYDSEKDTYLHHSLPLSVGQGELGIRQNDAVFMHTKNLSVLISKFEINDLKNKLLKVGVSTKPRDDENSYMPCFLSGKSVAVSIASVLSIPLYQTSHQMGHVISGVYCNKQEFLSLNKFLAVHLSGGTSELLYVEKENHNYKIKKIGGTLDINAGQLIDRTGVILGLNFPCGAELDMLCRGDANDNFKVKLSIKELYFNLSGHENVTQGMFKQGESYNNIAMYTIKAITLSLNAIIENALLYYKNMPILFTGGVSANTYLREYFLSKYKNIYFTSQELCGDNALGIAYGAFCAD